MADGAPAAAPELAGPSRARVAHSGYLVKQGHLLKSWKRRFFVLQAKNVFYYESAREDISGVSGVDLKGAITLTGWRESAERPRCLELSGMPKALLVQADDDEALEAWRRALAAALAPPAQ